MCSINDLTPTTPIISHKDRSSKEESFRKLDWTSSIKCLGLIEPYRNSSCIHRVNIEVKDSWLFEQNTFVMVSK